jgi:hypothetical protein
MKHSNFLWYGTFLIGKQLPAFWRSLLPQYLVHRKSASTGDGGRKLLWSICKYLPVDNASYVRRLASSYRNLMSSVLYLIVCIQFEISMLRQASKMTCFCSVSNCILKSIDKLTAWSRLPEKLIVALQINKYPAFCGMPRFFTCLTLHDGHGPSKIWILC